MLKCGICRNCTFKVVPHYTKSGLDSRGFHNLVTTGLFKGLHHFRTTYQFLPELLFFIIFKNVLKIISLKKIASSDSDKKKICIHAF